MAIKHSKVSAKSDGGDSSLVLPSDWNADHVLDGSFLGFIGAGLYKTSNQTMDTSGEGALVLDAEEYDTNGFHDNSTNNNRITIPSGMGGKYIVTINIRTSSDPGNGAYIAARKQTANQALLFVSPTIGSGNSLWWFHGSAQVDLAAGDYIEFKQLATNAIAMQAGTSYGPWVTLYKLDSGKVGQGIGARVVNTAATSISDNTPTAVPFATEDFDTDGFHDAGANTKLTVPAGLGGTYIVTGQLTFNANFTATNMYAIIRKNGTTDYAFQRTATESSVSQGRNVSAIIPLVSTDYIELIVNQNSGSAKSLESTSGYNSLAFMRLDSGSAPTFCGVIVTASVTVLTSTFPSASMTLTESVDTNGFHDPSTNNHRLTIPTGYDGYYMLTGQFQWGTSTGGSERLVYLNKNGSTEYLDLSRTRANGAGYANGTFSWITPLVAGDYLDFGAYQESGSSLSLGIQAQLIKIG